MDWPHQRSLYRIPYPVQERPTFEAGGSAYQVLDCSERGIRYALNGRAPGLRAVVTGTLRFRRGQAVEIEGEVVRIQDGCVALHLYPPGIPLRIIFQEQLHLRRYYPAAHELKAI